MNEVVGMLVIFDCDGVLVESEALAARVFSEELAKLSIALTPAECEALFVGRTLKNCIDFLAESYPGKIPLDFQAQIDVASEALFDREMQAIAGVKETLTWLETQNIPRCVGSNGSLHKIANSLRRTGLTHFFSEHVFSADLVAHPKPAPDLYWYAAEAMGVPPQFCVVIEDSEVGMKAALAAGIAVILFRPPWRAIHFTPPAEVQVLDDMHQLPQLLLKRRLSNPPSNTG